MGGYTIESELVGKEYDSLPGCMDANSQPRSTTNRSYVYFSTISNVLSDYKSIDVSRMEMAGPD
ncbi:hypothetical protein VroAM7_50460 (plasmid) [Vibrio rotiferianus]|uniref:Uncharacterized protein n=1 Tax=Vibrio rotiferianus TaxID=190895 RepID=A0A510IFA5_9VIBR|nr:hypothetical protein VroAM7_50460 [Vibrio rotiferianus]